MPCGGDGVPIPFLCDAMSWQLLSVAAVTTGEGRDKITIAGECVRVFVCVCSEQSGDFAVLVGGQQWMWLGALCPVPLPLLPGPTPSHTGQWGSGGHEWPIDMCAPHTTDPQTCCMCACSHSQWQVCGGHFTAHLLTCHVYMCLEWPRLGSHL